MDEFDRMKYAAARQRYQSGANWFYWIAGLTIITSVIGLMGGGWRFFLSFGTTQLIDGIANAASQGLGNATKVIAFVLDIFITAAFVAFGALAHKKHLWAYVAGMVVFLLDALVSFLFVDWIGILVHAFVLFVMFRGYQAGRELVALERSFAQAAAAQPVAAEPAPAAQPTY
ncbi:MAG TPA: hypothetical protein VGK82_06615 [Pyrinomonadaceae bacterium]